MAVSFPDGELLGVDDVLSAEKIAKEAYNGRYYSIETKSFQSIDPFEYFLRLGAHLFTLCVDSPETACLKYSWTKIEEMPELPEGIRSRMEDLFLDSRIPTNYQLSRCAPMISRIYAKTLIKEASDQGTPLEEIYIRQYPKHTKSFAILNQDKFSLLAASSRYGQLDFYNGQRERVLANSFDTLYDKEGRRIASIRLEVDYQQLDVSLEVRSPQDFRILEAIGDREQMSLVFRDAMTHKTLALANYNGDQFDIQWKIVLVDKQTLDEKNIPSTLLAWAVLKYSQCHHFQALSYVTPDDIRIPS